MTFEFRPGRRVDVSVLLGVSGGTGSGKTFTAMLVATGIGGGRPFAVIDTEAGRALHYGDRFKFDHGDLKPPFTAERYTDAIVAADKAGYPVVVVDSMSHEWAGDGGCLDQHDAELDRMAGTDWKKRDAANLAAWVRPKMAHKQMVMRLLQVRAHVILCFRAEPKVEMTREGGAWKIVEKKSLVGLHGWIPITEKNLPFELTASFLLMAEHPGVPLPIKLQEQHRAIFPLDRAITERAGQLLAEWAKGGTAAPGGGRAVVTTPNPTVRATTAEPPTTVNDHDAAAEWLAQITEAKTVDDLELVGRNLREVRGLSQPIVHKLREAYAARLKSFEAPQETP
jgi:AAA domain